ncbi:MAG: tRNA pseudouridine(13) synthase TruD, partial [Planctomycetaceae bacterium]
MTPDFESIARLDGFPTLHGKPPLPTAMLKQEPEDFIVEELPAYELSGTGEHLFLWIQKRDLSAEQLKKHIVRTLDIPGRDIGFAGNKDRRAVTRQFVSVPATSESRVGDLETPAVQVLRTERHTNKLRTGHLKGNRFELLLRATISEEQQAACIKRLHLVSERGFANYFGTQRFGGGDTPRLGWELLTGKLSRRSMTKEYGRGLFRLCLSSVQSMLFNEVLRRRI